MDRQEAKMMLWRYLDEVRNRFDLDPIDLWHDELWLAYQKLLPADQKLFTDKFRKLCRLK